LLSSGTERVRLDLAREARNNDVMASALFDPVRAHPLDIAVDGLAASVPLEMTEVAAIAHCDHMGRVLGTRHLRSIASDMVDMPVRRIAIDMLAFDAAAAVMAHNHPAGDPSPS